METKTFVSEELGVTFSVPARPNVRQQLAYRAAVVGATRDNLYIRFWEGVKALCVDWESDGAIKNPYEFDAEESDDPEAAQVIIWACNQMFDFVSGLEAVPKNS